MNYEVIATDAFARRLKKLAKKYKSLKSDLALLFDQLTENPTLGTPLGRDAYKIRIAIKSKGKGKSGGARIITYVRIINETVYLIDIYDKTDQSSISDSELSLLIELLSFD